MLRFAMFLRSFLAEPLRGTDRGATAVEYGLIVALIAAVIIVSVGILGGLVNTAFKDVIANW